MLNAVCRPNNANWLLAHPVASCGLIIGNEAFRAAEGLRLGQVLCAPHSNSPYCIVFFHFYSASQCMSLSEALPTIAIDTVAEFTRRSATVQATVSEELAQGDYVALERDSKPRPSGRKALTLPMRHHAQQVCGSWAGQDGHHVLVCRSVS